MFIDDILDLSNDALELIKEAKKNQLPITFISTGRTNEWNTHGEYFEQEVNSTFDLLDLNDNEFRNLLEKINSI